MRHYGKAVILASLILTATWVAARPLVPEPASQGTQTGQGQQAQQPPQQPPAPSAPGQAPTEPPKPRFAPTDQAEADAWNAASKEQDPAKRIVAINAFLEKFPQAGLKPIAYGILTILHLAMGDTDKSAECGEKAVELDPDNPQALAILSYVFARRSRASELDYRAKMQKAESYAKHSLELIDALTKPSAVTEEQFLKQKETYSIMAHSSLGIIYFNSGRYPLSTEELKQATEPKYAQVDPVDFYVLGRAYVNMKKYAEAVAALQKSYDEAPQGPFRDEVGQRLEDAKKKLAASQATPAPGTPAPPKP